MIDRAYLEITNICNLSCVFCPKNARPKRKMTLDEYNLLTDRLRGQIKFLYFHLMGEPMLHEHLSTFIKIAREKGFIPVLTTNGTLLAKGLTTFPHKIQISLHSQEANPIKDCHSEQSESAAGCHPEQSEGPHDSKIESPMEKYIHEVMTFAQKAATAGTIVVLRLWNQGGFDSKNEEVLNLISQHIAKELWVQRYDGWKLTEKIYIEYDQMFEWPEEERKAYDVDEVFCYALRNQVGILVDGTVVPCCLDHEGSIHLGNLYESSLEEILASPRAKAMYEGFSHHQAKEPLCQRCEYAAVTKRFRRPK